MDPTIELKIHGHANFPKLPFADNITKYEMKGKHTGGLNLFNKLSELCDKRHIEVLYETPAIELIRKGEEVVGVVAQSPKGKINIKAKKGVIITTGGYEVDPESLRNYCLGTEIHVLGTPGNTGDGLRLAQAVGAKLWHMTSYSCPLGIKIPGKQTLVLVNMMTPGYIWVNQDGRRFCNEAGIDFHSHLYAVNGFDTVRHKFPAIPCYLIMDEKGRTSGPITHFKFGYVSVREGYKWSKNSEKEIEAGIVKKADTVEELAKLINVPPEELAKTVKTWNENIAKGKDPEFGRLLEKPMSEKDYVVGATARKLSAPLAQGPFYAIPMYPALLNTQGGPRRNSRANVLNGLGRPIPRLYVAGELGSIWGTIYQGSSNIAECLVYGRIAGRNAAKEKSWS